MLAFATPQAVIFCTTEKLPVMVVVAVQDMVVVAVQEE